MFHEKCRNDSIEAIRIQNIDNQLRDDDRTRLYPADDLSGFGFQNPVLLQLVLKGSAGDL